jgi:hypothetical protein
MHYSIVEPEDDAGKAVLHNVLRWLDSRPELRAEREKYKTVCCTPELLVQIARTPINFIPASEVGTEPVEEDRPIRTEAPQRAEPEYAYAGDGHNEIEEFLL